MNQDEFIEQLKEKIVDTVSRCRNCNFCYSVCPLFESTRGFQIQGPSGIMQAIYYAIRWDEMHGENRQALKDILYGCTTCYSCVLKCKSSSSGVPLLDAIEGGRELLVELMMGPMPGHIKILESLKKTGNPYGEPASKRLAWLKDLEKNGPLHYKLLPGEDAEILLYVGCTPSYNEAIQNVAQSVVKLLERIHADYGILRAEECCGSPAKRIGDEGLFEDLSHKNLKAFRECGVQKIITISPHCYNAFINEYPEAIHTFKVQQYTEFFSQAIERKELIPRSKIENVLTYQDPCYLGKRNAVYEDPRKILKSIPGVKFVEMKRNKDNSLCCGGGGGRMWIEIDEIKRLSEIRVQDALDVGAEVIAAGCPWCHIQLEDAIKTTDNEGRIAVKEVAELLAESAISRA